MPGISGNLLPSERIAAWFSARLRTIHHEKETIAEELSRFPTPHFGPTSEAIGFHSSGPRSNQGFQWVQVDLGSEHSIDWITLVPAHVAAGEDAGGGYGFPKRFRIEAGMRSDGSDSRVGGDCSSEDVASAGGAPFIMDTHGERARFVKVVVIRPWERKGSANRTVFALGELMILEGNRNIAIDRAVTASDSIETPPQWARSSLGDGQNILGLPQEPTPSPSNGYHSAEWEKRQDAEKWVQVDLGKTMPIEEVRLIPARPRDWALISGFGFPIRFRLEGSEDSNFKHPQLLRAEDAGDLPNPGDNVVTTRCEGAKARYLRITATKLWSRGDYYALALAEMQVYSHGTNAALHAKVDALDATEGGLWSRQALVDGFSSQQQLMELNPWMQRLSRASQLQVRWKTLNAEQTQLTNSVLGQATQWAIGTLAVLVIAALAVMHRYRLVRLLEMERLRTRIATDLHDELGTRLTRIGMLTDRVDHQTDENHPAKPQVAEIFRMTREAVRTMDEIVWAVNPRNDTLEDLANYIFQFAQDFFRDSPTRCRLDIPAELPVIALSTEVRHHLFLAVKEALNNVMKHAQAKNVQVAMRWESGVVSVSIRDDGRGFSTTLHERAGNGLRNMEQRLTNIGGKMSIQSSDGNGTLIRFEARLPMKSSASRAVGGN